MQAWYRYRKVLTDSIGKVLVKHIIRLMEAPFFTSIYIFVKHKSTHITGTNE